MHACNAPVSKLPLLPLPDLLPPLVHRRAIGTLTPTLTPTLTLTPTCTITAVAATGNRHPCGGSFRTRVDAATTTTVAVAHQLGVSVVG